MHRTLLCRASFPEKWNINRSLISTRHTVTANGKYLTVFAYDDYAVILLAKYSAIVTSCDNFPKTFATRKKSRVQKKKNTFVIASAAADSYCIRRYFLGQCAQQLERFFSKTYSREDVTCALYTVQCTRIVNYYLLLLLLLLPTAYLPSNHCYTVFIVYNVSAV